MNFITSWDDGSIEDLRLSQLLEKYKIPGIFYIPTNCELLAIDIIYINTLGFTIGGHCKTHPDDLKRLSSKDQFDEIYNNKIYLEEKLGHEINSFCYPSGRYNEITIKNVKLAGFKSARTTLVGNIKEPEDKFRIKTSIHVHPNRKEYNGEQWYEVAKRLLDKAVKEDGYFHLWGHSWELTKFDLWNELEEFFKYINNIKYEK